MAYFSNGAMGSCFEDECSKCKFGNSPCPIAQVQFNYNYEAVNNPTATSILGDLVTNNGTCTMLKMFPELKKEL